MCSYFTIIQNWAYLGNYLDLPSIQTTYGECCIQCSRLYKCNVFTWNRITHECYIISSNESGRQLDFEISGLIYKGKLIFYNLFHFSRRFQFLQIYLLIKFHSMKHVKCVSCETTFFFQV